jgi:hypothetical protein
MARKSLLEFARTEGFEREDGENPYSGGNQCVLDLAVAVFHVVESALLLENTAAAVWTPADRSLLQAWLVEEVFDLVAWPIDGRKNNWGVLGVGSAAAIATYVDFCTPLYDWRGRRWSPAGYLDAVDTKVRLWASPTVAMDSACAEIGAPFGYQAHGALPDEQRRGPGDDGAECRARRIADLCSGSKGCSVGHLYSLKTLNALVRVAELMRRQGDARLFVFPIGAGADLRTIYDYVTGGQGSFDRHPILQEFASLAYVLGAYYRLPAMRAVRLEDGTKVRGGRDYAYGAITHAEGL